MLPVHPGRILKRESIARCLSADRLASALRLPPGSISEILDGKRGIPPDVALRLSIYFGNRARFWSNLQTAYDLASCDKPGP